MGIDALMPGLPRARAVFLDRDGVLNRTVVRDGAPRPPGTVDEVEILAGVPEALASLGRRGLLRIVVTNQPDVARGVQTRQAVEAINDYLRGRLHLDGVFTCYHDDRDACGCRKPAPGLIVAAAARHQVDVGRSFMVGDRWRDVAAGRAAGCRTFLVRAPYSERERCRPDHEVGDLAEAAREILRQLGKGEEG